MNHLTQPTQVTTNPEHQTGHRSHDPPSTPRAGAPASSYALWSRRRLPSPMPSLLKDRHPTGRLGRLIAALRPTRDGALPVQTGFPTSLADLVVKNHGRLKKPSSKRKKRDVSHLPSPSPFRPPSPSPPPSSPSPSPSPPPPAAVSVSARPGPDLLPVEFICHARGDGFGLGLGFVALVCVVSLALLVIWSRKVVAAVTITAFSLFLLEAVRSCSLPQMPRAPAAAKLDLDGRGYVSPIREVDAESEPLRPSSSDSDGGSEVSFVDIEEKSVIDDDSSKSKKRSWKKLIANKLQKGKKCKVVGSSGSFRSETSQSDAMIGGNAEATDSRHGKCSQADADAGAVPKSSDPGGSRHGMGNETYTEVHDNVRPTEIDDPTETGNVGGSQFPALVVAAVVLVGLVAGRLPAVAFTVLCSAFVSSLQRLAWHRWRQLEEKGGD